MSSMLDARTAAAAHCDDCAQRTRGFWLALQWYWQYCGAALPMLKNLACALDVPMAELLR